MEKNASSEQLMTELSIGDSAQSLIPSPNPSVSDTAHGPQNSPSSLAVRPTDLAEIIKVCNMAIRGWRSHPNYDEIESEALVVLAEWLLTDKPIGYLVVSLRNMCYHIGSTLAVRIPTTTKRRKGISQRSTTLTEPWYIDDSVAWKEVLSRVDEERILELWLRGYFDAEIADIIGRSRSYVTKKRGQLQINMWRMWK